MADFAPSSSVDPREVAHYTALANTWWDPTGPFWPLHTLNRLRVEWILQQLTDAGLATGPGDSPLSGISVLDVGCGGGILAESMARFGARVHGIDVVERNIAIASSHAAPELDLEYQQVTAEELAEQGRSYDVVLNMEVVEHVADLPGFMAACGQLVRPGGVTFVATINRTPLAWFTAIFGAEVVLRWLPRGTHRYGLLRRPEEITRELEKSSIEPRAWTGVRVNPITRRMSLTRSLAINYMLSAVREGPF
ncbi:MAG: bifunctional 2-polyprenyl-6-hydroxyphenol methylase/3-demethylubiquinol 3-O-methyltransferase UbiG [Xanthomonadales bacterium]|nr:bifunctional 2-polyprenyl-6-hydroxyphenol methylase/3-demethylubiquinol 3-O-methyltransferase UbiG [Xanthomonadales bacterium]